jgi:Arc/MetJ-type ribon-helix-helix transcriptional regulator
MQYGWWGTIPVVLAAVGYLLRRWLERRRRSEGLRLKLQALALHQGLRRAGLSLEDLERIEDRATRRRRWFLGQ